LVAALLHTNVTRTTNAINLPGLKENDGRKKEEKG